MIKIEVRTVACAPQRNLASRLEAYLQERAKYGWTLRSSFVESGLVYLTFACKEKGSTK